MANLKNIKETLNLGDLAIVPAILSDIDSRNDVMTTYENGQSPFFVAPMDTVLNKENYKTFMDAGLNVCLPRGIYLEENTPNVFESYSLDEFIQKFIKNQEQPKHWYIHIDIANGHMSKLFNACADAKDIYGSDLILMIGNIANPETYASFAEIGVDYCKFGIGMGAVCTTTTHTGVHYPMASLLMEARMIKEKAGYSTNIIADGGISSTADINIALACGADFVMMGSIFNKTNEACGQAYLSNRIPIPNRSIAFFKRLGFKVYRKYRGMSTTEVQKSWRKKILRPSEGIHKRNEVLFTLEELISNLNHRLATAMSYTGDKYLETFVAGETELVKKTTDTNNRVNK